MSTGICSCGTPTFGNLARPNCVITQKALAFPIMIPRYKSDGSRNTIDLAADPLTYLNPLGVAGDYATLGAYIKSKIEDSEWDAQERFYPMPRVENATFERTEINRHHTRHHFWQTHVLLHRPRKMGNRSRIAVQFF